MVKRVIINADDYGLCPSVTAGILNAWQARAITSTTVLGNLCPAEDLLKLRASGLPAGLHVNLVEGPPLTGREDLEAIVDREGQFRGITRLAWAVGCGQLRRPRILAEVRAQARRVADAGVAVDHVDGHRHAHHLPVVADVAAQVGSEAQAVGYRRACEPLTFELPHIRAGLKKFAIAPFAWWSSRVYRRYGLKTSDAFFGLALLDAGSPVDALTRAVRRIDDGVTEIAVHIAADSADSPEAIANYRTNLRALLEVCAGSEMRASGVEMTSFGAAMRRP